VEGVVVVFCGGWGGVLLGVGFLRVCVVRKGGGQGRMMDVSDSVRKCIL
jgi:hypothetical protein